MYNMDKTNLLLKEYHEAVEEIRHRRDLLIHATYIGFSAGGVCLTIFIETVYSSNSTFSNPSLFFLLSLFIAIAGVIALIGATINFRSQNDAKKMATDRAIEIEKELKNTKNEICFISKIKHRKDTKNEICLISKIEHRKKEENLFDSMSNCIIPYAPIVGFFFWIIFWVFILYTLYTIR